MKLLVLLFSLSFSLFAKIIECDHFEELAAYAADDTLLVLDIDDTLLVPVQMVGSDEWFQYRLKHHSKENPTEALEKSLAEWEGVRHLTKMEIVEQGSEKIIRQLQEKAVPIMGLTTQGLALATRTSLQLLEKQIDLSITSPSKKDHYFSLDDHGILYKNGVLFTSGKNKGEAFFQFCALVDYVPKKIVFINDKASHLRELEEAAIARSVDFIGLRYSYSDARKAAFSVDLAEYQFSHSPLNGILSDQAALEKFSN